MLSKPWFLKVTLHQPISLSEFSPNPTSKTRQVGLPNQLVYVSRVPTRKSLTFTSGAKTIFEIPSHLPGTQLTILEEGGTVASTPLFLVSVCHVESERSRPECISNFRNHQDFIHVEEPMEGREQYYRNSCGSIWRSAICCLTQFKTAYWIFRCSYWV